MSQCTHSDFNHKNHKGWVGKFWFCKPIGWNIIVIKGLAGWNWSLIIPILVKNKVLEKVYPDTYNFYHWFLI